MQVATLALGVREEQDAQPIRLDRPGIPALHRPWLGRAVEGHHLRQAERRCPTPCRKVDADRRGGILVRRIDEYREDVAAVRVEPGVGTDDGQALDVVVLALAEEPEEASAQRGQPSQCRDELGAVRKPCT